MHPSEIQRSLSGDRPGWEPEADYDEPGERQGPEALQTIGDLMFANKDLTRDNYADQYPDHNRVKGTRKFSRHNLRDHDDQISDDEEDAEGNPKTFKRVFVRFAERTSMQGVPYIYVSSVWYAKLGWTVLFIAGFGAMVFHLVYLSLIFFAYNTSTTVTLGFNTLNFPAVTVCNVNAVRTSKMGLASEALEEFVESVRPSNIVAGMEEKRKTDENMKKRKEEEAKANSPNPTSNNQGSSTSSGDAGTPTGKNNMFNQNSNAGSNTGRSGTDSNINDIGTNSNINDSGTNSNINDSGANSNINDSVTDSNINDSGTDNNINDSGANSNINDSVTNSNINDSGTNSNINDSGTNSNINDSGTNSNINDSGTNSNINDSGTNSNINDSGTNSNINDSGTNNNINDSGTNNNINDSGTNNNIDDSGTNSNSDDSGTDSNINDDGANSNINDSGTDMNNRRSDNSFNSDSASTNHDGNSNDNTGTSNVGNTTNNIANKGLDTTTQAAPEPTQNVRENSRDGPQNGDSVSNDPHDGQPKEMDTSSVQSTPQETTTLISSQDKGGLGTGDSGNGSEGPDDQTKSNANQDVTFGTDTTSASTTTTTTTTTTMTTTTSTTSTSTPKSITTTSTTTNTDKTTAEVGMSTKSSDAGTTTGESLINDNVVTTKPTSVTDHTRHDTTDNAVASSTSRPSIPDTNIDTTTTTTTTTKLSTSKEAEATAENDQMTTNNSGQTNTTGTSGEISNTTNAADGHPDSSILASNSSKANLTDPLLSNEGQPSTSGTNDGGSETPSFNDGKINNEGAEEENMEPSSDSKSSGTSPTEGTNQNEGLNKDLSSQQPSGSTRREKARKRRSVEEDGAEHHRVKRFIKGFDLEESNNRYTKDHAEMDEKEVFSGNKSQIRVIEDEFKYLYSILPRDTREEMGHDINRMLMECTFRGITCNSNQFTLLSTAEYGNCYTLEDTRFISTLGGPSDGLTLIVFLEDEEYLEGITSSLGLQVHIHAPGSMPNPYDEGLSVPGGMETSIGLKQVNIEREPWPYGDCVTGDDFQAAYNTTYTQRTCQQFCVQRNVISRCQCFDPEKDEIHRRIALHNERWQPCTTDDDVICLHGVQSDYRNGNLGCHCPSPCSETVYEKSTSFKVWPTTDYASILVEYLCSALNETVCETYASKTRSELATSFLKVVIYFQDLNYENITEQPDYEAFQFASDIGGTIGLWIGLSLISFFEVIQFVYELFHFMCYVRPKQAKKEKKRKKLRQQKMAARHAIRLTHQLKTSALMQPSAFNSSFIPSNDTLGPTTRDTSLPNSSSSSTRNMNENNINDLNKLILIPGKSLPIENRSGYNNLSLDRTNLSSKDNQAGFPSMTYDRTSHRPPRGFQSRLQGVDHYLPNGESNLLMSKKRGTTGSPLRLDGYTNFGFPEGLSAYPPGMKEDSSLSLADVQIKNPFTEENIYEMNFDDKLYR